MRFSAFLISMMIAAAGAAQAQFAAPPLAPLVLGTTTGNPATLQWNDYSFVGIGLARGDQTAVSGGNPDPQNEGDFEAGFVQGRVVYEFFSVGVEFGGAEENLGNPTVGATNTELGLFNAGLAFRIGDAVALGLGIEAFEFNETLPPAPTSTFETSLPLAGISIRLAEIYFLGAAVGKETVTSNLFPGEFDRNVVRFGAAIRTGRDTVQWHLEAYREARHPFDLGPGGKIGEFDASGVVVELNWSGLLIGVYTNTSTDKEVDGAGVVQKDEESREATITVGWVPEGGISLVASLSGEETDDNLNPGDTQERESIVVGVSWVF